MAQQTIHFRIRPDGRVEERVDGIQGDGCEQLTDRIEARIGSLQQRRRTSEAYQAQPLEAVPQQMVQQRPG
ncbi:MAG: DUF2997 domain-containing protein [Prochlorococcaceae cyanobacterium]